MSPDQDAPDIDLWQGDTQAAGPAAEGPALNTDLMRRWLTLDGRKHQLKEELETVAAELKTLEAQVLDEFANSGIDKVHIDGRTVHLVCNRWPKIKQSRPALIEAMKMNGLAAFVKEDFNLQSLRGVTNEWIRECLADLPKAERAMFDLNSAIPEPLREVLGINEVLTVQSKA